jgi:hypothetical protein
MGMPPMPPDAPGVSGNELDPTLDQPERTEEEIEDGEGEPNEAE